MPTAAPYVELTVAAAPTAAAQARRALARQRLVCSSVEPTLLLLVSELVSNSVRHAGLDGGERIRLRASCGADRARVEVCDTGRSGRLPGRRPRRFGEVEPGGLGLVLVDEMAQSWGVARRDDETCVWFELDCG
jgi:anti-sigma regulatory factor (Ser/Thr protein kinase)